MPGEGLGGRALSLTVLLGKPPEPHLPVLLQLRSRARTWEMGEAETPRRCLAKLWPAQHLGTSAQHQTCNPPAAHLRIGKGATGTLRRHSCWAPTPRIRSRLCPSNAALSAEAPPPRSSEACLQGQCLWTDRLRCWTAGGHAAAPDSLSSRRGRIATQGLRLRSRDGARGEAGSTQHPPSLESIRV